MTLHYSYLMRIYIWWAQCNSIKTITQFSFSKIFWYQWNVATFLASEMFPGKKNKLISPSHFTKWVPICLATKPDTKLILKDTNKAERLKSMFCWKGFANHAILTAILKLGWIIVWTNGSYTKKYLERHQTRLIQYSFITKGL